MIKAMQLVSTSLLEKHVNLTNMTRIGFHVPPFTTVPHLHMHAITLPFNNKIRWLKYPEPWKSNRWYIGTQRLIDCMEQRTASVDANDRWTWKWVTKE